jgi:hypothetical protein
MNNSELEVTTCTQKGFLSGGSPIIGMVRNNDINQNCRLQLAKAQK